MFKLPYQSEAERGHQDLKKLHPVYQEGFARLVTLASSPAPFAERFAQVTREHQKIAEAGLMLPQTGPLMEPDIYRVCMFDLLNAMVGTEIERILGAGVPAEQKKQQLEALTPPIDALNWSGPIWERIEKPRLKKRVTDALSRL